MEEIWKDVIGYEGYYQVSNLGRVRSNFDGHIMSQYQGNTGYMYLRLGKCNYDKKKLRMVHRLVAEAFIPNPNNLPFISHKDETKTNNYADNLEWVSAKENNNMPKHKKRISTKRKQISMKGKANVSPIQCNGILYNTLTEFSISWGLNPSTVWRWLKGKTKMPKGWKNRGLKYAE